ncbi:hypothetical protein EV379_1211 [Microterricola gilva]|uniref:DUF7448 domain-containing protein n=1 Tax=Microterricola gilva TaxID=393267 RepID=A0A4Q8AK77_9MICO|nr:hypothetical protein [Microterricola gilva]RZU64900.1 hypothetical protein EV379_1211 [Microterricola gilva]
MSENKTESYFEETRVELSAAVVGQRIVKAEVDRSGREDELKLMLESGREVAVSGWGSCCAWAGVGEILLDLQNVEHVITSVEATGGDGVGSGEKWFILANLDQVLGFETDASEGTGYYGYGLSVNVREEAPSD